MSQVYATEPSTSGRVLLETTHGPIGVNLWCRECPATVRFVLQLVTDGYYDGLVFHRILSNFLIQTGVRHPNQWSAWKKHNATLVEQYLERRPLERHSRIKFNHRGQVAMALPLNENDELLEPQFFITLDEAPYLNEKHLIIGTVAMGPTVFNALRIGTVTNVDEQGQPLDLDDAPRIKSTTILSYELDEPSTLHIGSVLPWKDTKAKEDSKIKKKKRKGKKDINVLSFGGDDEMEENGEGIGMKSLHDVVDKKNKKKKTSAGKVSGDDTRREPVSLDEIQSKAKGESNPEVVPEEIQRTMVPSDAAASRKHGPVANKAKLSLDNNGDDKSQPSQRKEKKMSATSVVEAKRLKYLKSSSKSKKQREEDTMAKLLAFQGKVRVRHSKEKLSSKEGKDSSLASRMAKRQRQAQEEDKEKEQQEIPTYHGQVMDDSDKEDEQGWLATKFHCRQHMDQRARGGDGRKMEDYVVIDSKNGGSHKKRSKEKK